MVRRSLRTSSISSAQPTLKKTPERAASSARKRAGSPNEASSSKRASRRGKEDTQDLSHRPKPTKSNGYHSRDSRDRGSRDSGADLAATSSNNSESSSDEDDEQSYSDYDERQSSVNGASGGSEASSNSMAESEFEDDVKRKKKHASHNKYSTVRNKKSGASSREEAPTPSNVKGNKGSELWRQGVRAGLGPGTEMVIERPKPRDAGKVPYSDDTIHPNTMLFLGDLRANNDREWLKMHDPEYRRALKDFQSFIECLSERITEIDDTIPELPTKDIIFRIYRDIRFSPDPTPYKHGERSEQSPYMFPVMLLKQQRSRTGRKGPYAAYYMQIKPGGSYVGGGLWMPEAAALAAIRENINERPEDIKGVLMNSLLQEEFFPDTLGKEAQTIKAFAARSAENALKTKPKGYTVDHPNIELLRLRNFIVGKSLTDREVIGPGGLDCIARVILALVPFITYLNQIVMPDEG